MSTLNSYRIDLKNMKSEKQDFWFHLDDVFFQTVDGPEIKSGDLKAHLLVRKTSGAFEFHIDVEGSIQIQCDRCLDMMNLPVQTETLIKVRLGEEYGRRMGAGQNVGGRYRLGRRSRQFARREGGVPQALRRFVAKLCGPEGRGVPTRNVHARTRIKNHQARGGHPPPQTKTMKIKEG